MSEIAILPHAAAEIGRLRAAWPDEFRDGARCAFLEKYEGERELDGYPKGFHGWPQDRRNAWFAGFNRGLCDRQSMEAGNVGTA
ncbi:hypothetical protein [Rhodoblastus sp.]|uniref:hypothetical protein n=1 Tax=Rhodoblastus sp. TaxID=1962975 RepID=UPI003F9A3FDF